MITIDSEEKNTQQSILRKHFEMLYPDKLKDDEWIRLVGIRKDETGSPESTLVKFVKTYDEYEEFVFKYRYTYDLYNQIATNKGNENGNARSQRCRKVLYMDFNQKNYPNITDAEQFTELIKSKIPKLFLIACVNSGHGYHFYISIKQSCRISEVVKLNKEIVRIVGADPKAASSAQIARIPCTYNHKQNDGSYNYNDSTTWTYVKSVFNSYEGDLYKPLDISYIQKLVSEYYKKIETYEIIEKVPWDYTSGADKCYLCIQKVMNEGADEGQRNFWHGRIVSFLKKNGYSNAKIYAACKDYNLKCRPPKTDKVIEEDTKRFIESDYNLLGCYGAFEENDPRHMWIVAQCDEGYCKNHYEESRKINEYDPGVKINKKILTNSNLRTMSGNAYLIMTMIDIYEGFNRKHGFKVKKLHKLLYSSVKKKYYMSEKSLQMLLLTLENKKWIRLINDNKHPKDFMKCSIETTKRLKEFQQGHIEFYFSIGSALINGFITQTEYLVYITLLRNLSDNKPVTYEEISYATNIDKANVGRAIRRLEQERSLIIEKVDSESGKECNKYHFNGPTLFKEADAIRNNIENIRRTSLEVHDEDNNEVYITTFIA